MESVSMGKFTEAELVAMKQSLLFAFENGSPKWAWRDIAEKVYDRVTKTLEVHFPNSQP